MENKCQLLFVCTANIYRSQLAQACCSWLFGLDQWSGWRDVPVATPLAIESAGIIADTSLYTPRSVCSALQARGIPWDARPARRLRPSLMHGAAVVLAMEENQAAEIRRSFPDKWRSVTTLGKFGAAARQTELTAATLQGRMRQLLDMSMNMSDEAHRRELDVRDPSTGGEAAVRSCLREIESHLAWVAQCVLFGNQK
ncbi:hypothetical protein ABZ504_52580 [Streptomyces mirabilis]|uniref:arsenate-mycothiol transferase ArsC n=1 Tax=Streptomyces mirabilis TaxID=68239 RepID=UPI00340C72B3